MDLFVVVVAFGLLIAAGLVIRWMVRRWDAGELQRKATVAASILALAAAVIGVVNRPMERLWDTFLDRQPSNSDRRPDRGVASPPEPTPSRPPTGDPGPVRPSAPVTTPPADGTAIGDWHDTNGPVTVRVTRVERRDGLLTLSMKAENRAAEAASLSLFHNFVVTDDTGRTYEADLGSSDWSGEVPSGGFITGTVALSKQTDPQAKTLTISFTTFYIFRTVVNGGITIRKVRIPRS